MHFLLRTIGDVAATLNMPPARSQALARDRRQPRSDRQSAPGRPGRLEGLAVWIVEGLEPKVFICAHTVVTAASMAFSAVVIAALPWKPPAAICDRPRPVGHAGDSQFACAGFVEVDRQVVAFGQIDAVVGASLAS
jgi:hypothetical protein